MADALDSGSSTGNGIVGSSPVPRTKVETWRYKLKMRGQPLIFFAIYNKFGSLITKSSFACTFWQILIVQSN